MRKRIIEADLIDCVLGLGPGLFYNSPMEACVLFCRTKKPVERRGKVLFINAVDEYFRNRNQSFLSHENVARIIGAYADGDQAGFARLVDVDEIAARDFRLSIPLFVAPSRKQAADDEPLVAATATEWKRVAGRVREDARLAVAACEGEVV